LKKPQHMFLSLCQCLSSRAPLPAPSPQARLWNRDPVGYPSPVARAWSVCNAREIRRWSIRPPLTCSIEDCVRPDSTLCVDCTVASAPAAMAAYTGSQSKDRDSALRAECFGLALTVQRFRK
jgi:hypothetical protein